jgi:acetylornithine deacetylase/succinyl-diaminopimelate desuccinylase-like protein
MPIQRSLALSRALYCVFLAAASSAIAATPADANDARAREIYARLISIPTQEGNGKVPALVDYLVGEFRAAGFPAEDIHVLPFQGDAANGGKGDRTASLVVRYRGNGKGGKPIALLAHMDVVTAKREDWERDPYQLVEENGYFFGRGTYDNKQGVAALVATFLRFKAEKFVPARDLIIAFSGDEETAQASTRDMVVKHRALVDAEYALNSDAGGGALDDESGKPLYFALQTAEKTYADFSVTARNAGGHSSQPRKDNAIYELAAALQRLAQFRFPVMTNETTLASFKAAGRTTPGELGEMLARFGANPRDEAAADFLAREPSYVGQTRTTCIATMLAGGHAENALPQSAAANVNCRIFPGTKIEDVRATLQKVMEPGVEVKLKGEPMSSDASPLRKDVLDAVTRAVHRIRPGVAVVPQQTSGATDGLVFRANGIPTYGVDGNFMRPKDEFAHGLNERILVQSFYDSLDYWHALLTDLAGRRK